MSSRLIKQELFLYEKFGDMVNIDGKKSETIYAY